MNTGEKHNQTLDMKFVREIFWVKKWKIEGNVEESVQVKRDVYFWKIVWINILIIQNVSKVV